jgi:hypothetical protein
MVSAGYVMAGRPDVMLPALTSRLGRLLFREVSGRMCLSELRAGDSQMGAVMMLVFVAY